MPDFVVHRTRTVKECVLVAASDEDAAEAIAAEHDDDMWGETDSDFVIDKVLPAVHHYELEDCDE